MTTPDQIKQLNKRKGRRLTSDQKTRILNLHSHGYSAHQIAERMGIAHSTAHYYTPSRSHASAVQARRDRQMAKSRELGAAVPRVTATGKPRRLTATPPGTIKRAPTRRITATPPPA